MELGGKEPGGKEPGKELRAREPGKELRAKEPGKELRAKEPGGKEPGGKEPVSDGTYKILVDRSRTLHTQIAAKWTPTQGQAETFVKILEYYIGRIKQLIDGTATEVDLELKSLNVAVGVAVGVAAFKESTTTYVDPHTGKWLYSTLRYFVNDEPASNYSTVWAFQMDPFEPTGYIMRPYTMPGLSTADYGASISLKKHGNIWLVTFEKLPSGVLPYTLYETPENDRQLRALYVKERQSKRDVYFVPHNLVSRTREQDIIGTTENHLYDVYVWNMRGVDQALDYYPVPVSEN